MRYRTGLRSHLIILLAGLLILYYILTMGLSSLLLERYHLYKIRKALVSAYEDLAGMDTLDYEKISTLEASNFTIVLADPENYSVIYNSQASDRFIPDMQDRIFPELIMKFQELDDDYFIDTSEMLQRTTSGATISSGQRIRLGAVTDHYLIEISTSASSVSSAVTLSRNFMLIAGLIVLVFGVLLAVRMSDSVIHPIIEITNVSDKIAHLDFSQHCDTSAGGEISRLAESINTMSDFMQSHIQQLQGANAQLTEDIAAAKEQEKARENLMANLSHDLKTPIGLISGYADGLRSGMAQSPEQISEYCDVICDESDRMMQMISRMMELFRLESGNIEPEPEMFDLKDMLSYMLDIFSLEMQQQGIKLTVNTPESAYVYADYSCCEQVISNYMQNAMSHINHGSDIRVSIVPRDAYYRISIFNSSDPIPEEELGRIWQAFYRLDKSRGREKRESGLGLSIVQRNMELLNCPYGSENVDGGVCFWAEFPQYEP